MKKHILAIFIISSAFCSGEENTGWQSDAFDAIITDKLFKQFSDALDLKPLSRKERKNIIEYSVQPIGITVSVAPAFTLLPKEKIVEDKAGIAKAKSALEDYKKALESEKAKLTKEEYQKAALIIQAASEITSISTDESTRYPDLGKQALHTGWTDGDKIIFTTSDEMYDVMIERMFTKSVFFRTPEMARSISDTYDKTTPTSRGDQ